MKKERSVTKENPTVMKGAETLQVMSDNDRGNTYEYVILNMQLLKV